MAFINVGAQINGQNVPTKRALKEEIDKVMFHSTSPFVGFYNGWQGLLDEAPTTKLSVVGPDPERDRKWYATVEIVGGKVKVT